MLSCSYIARMVADSISYIVRMAGQCVPRMFGVFAAG